MRTTTTTTTTTTTATMPIPTTLASPIIRPVNTIPRVHPQPTVQEVTKDSRNYNNNNHDRTRTTASTNIRAKVSKSWERDEQDERKWMTTTPKIPDGPRQTFVEFRPQERLLRSSCPDAMQRCEADGGCRWHVAELSVRCRSDTCKRQECSMALQRFASYVPRPLSEPLMFCHCAAHDERCLQQQSLFYPKCLYMPAETPRTCSQLVIECSMSVRCNQLRTSIASVCPVTKGICATDNLDHCRQTLLYSRGSLLEAPCFCAISDIECLKHQNAMIPNNPCIEKAMMDYSKLMGYMSPSNKMYTETNRVIVQEKEERNLQDEFEMARRRNETNRQVKLKPTKAPPRTTAKVMSKEEEEEKEKEEEEEEEEEEMAVQKPPTQHPHRKAPKTTPALELFEEIYVTKADTQLDPTNIDWIKNKHNLWKPIVQEKEEEKRENEMNDREKEREKQRLRTQQRLEQMRANENKKKAQNEEIDRKKKDDESENSMDTFLKQKSDKDKRVKEKGEPVKGSDDEEVVVKDAEKLQKTIVRQKSQRSTTAAPILNHLFTSSEMPPWVSSTATTQPKPTEYMTIAAPVNEDKCSIKDANGKELYVHVGSIIRRNLDWAGRCSSWCECVNVEEMICERLPCHADIPCEAPLTNMDFGERLYLQGRGACMCESGVFVCDTPEQLPELQSGLYILAGYSLADLEMLRKEIPQEVLSRAGLLSTDVGKDIASQLQWALERRLPEEMKCRIVMLEKYSYDGNAFYQIEYFGNNIFQNDTRNIWRSDGMEKMCSPYVRQLVEGFALNESPRFQLILSSVRQLRLVDLLDDLCFGKNTTTFLRSEGMQLVEFPIETIDNSTLNQCAEACIKKAKSSPCASFIYDPMKQKCSLHEVNGQPFGASILARATHGTSTSFFQHICVQKEALCSTPYAFERYPQQVLFGHAMEVQQTGGLSECLSICLTSDSLLNVPCRSVMYYYETGECIMNRETRGDHPDLFVSAPHDAIVDYFENNCHNAECQDGSTVHWIRSEEFQISPQKDVIVEAESQEECRQICNQNQVAGEKFPCRGFVYSSTQKECHLSAESGFNRRVKQGDLSPINGGEYYEKNCLQSDLLCGEAAFEQVANKRLNGSSFVERSPSVRRCLEHCLKQGDKCASISYDYDKEECWSSPDSRLTQPDQYDTVENVDYFDKVCDNVPNPKGKSKRGYHGIATDVRNDEDPPVTPTPLPDLDDDGKDQIPTSFPILSLNLSRHRTRLFEASTFPKLIETSEETNEETIHYDDHKINKNIYTSTISSEEFTNTMNVLDDLEPSREFVAADDPNAVKTKLRTECRLSEISVSLTFNRPTSGAIFIKDHFSTCRFEFRENDYAVLSIPYPNRDDENPKCPGFELEPDIWSFVVVVQKNQMEVPSLMTAADKTFNVTCDYSNVDWHSSDAAATTAASSSSDLPDDLIDVSGEDSTLYTSTRSTPSEKIRMLILKDGQTVSAVQLGELVELKWEITDRRQGVGYFVSDCVAERMGGLPPSPQPLSIIQHGCPDSKVVNRLMEGIVEQLPDGFSAKMKVFRFDGSRRVRLRCTIDVCVDECPPVECDGFDSEIKSYGKRKKRQTMGELSTMMRRLKPNFRLDDTTMKTTTTRVPKFTEMMMVEEEKRKTTNTITGILTVIDPPLYDEDGNPQQAHSPNNQPLFLSGSHQVICVFRPIFISVSLLLFLLFIIQTLIIGRFVSRHILQRTEESLYGSSTSCNRSSQSGLLIGDTDSTRSISPLVFPKTPQIQPPPRPAKRRLDCLDERFLNIPSSSPFPPRPPLPLHTDIHGYTVPIRPRHSWELDSSL
ncbi:unnamed protein product, partial [Mesorhabditis belari]|uniref:Uncharacterized protein n=1 Tax=Mesorhabditis belari TaxID=2138241 RepID=A0AAF3FNV6_9BILA